VSKAKAVMGEEQGQSTSAKKKAWKLTDDQVEFAKMKLKERYPAKSGFVDMHDLSVIAQDVMDADPSSFPTYAEELQKVMDEGYSEPASGGSAMEEELDHDHFTKARTTNKVKPTADELWEIHNLKGKPSRNKQWIVVVDRKGRRTIEQRVKRGGRSDRKKRAINARRKNDLREVEKELLHYIGDSLTGIRLVWFYLCVLCIRFS
jgi:hypothetical protein